MGRHSFSFTEKEINVLEQLTGDECIQFEMVPPEALKANPILARHARLAISLHKKIKKVKDQAKPPKQDKPK